MDFKIIWSDSAIHDLKLICEYIAKDNPDAATRVGHGILDHVKILETFPLIGPAYPRRSSGKIREIVYGKYRVFYEVDLEAKVLNVLRVWHSAQDESNLSY